MFLPTSLIKGVTKEAAGRRWKSSSLGSLKEGSKGAKSSGKWSERVSETICQARPRQMTTTRYTFLGHECVHFP